MFHTYNFGGSTFYEWLDVTNQLRLQEYLELGGVKKDFSPFRLTDMTASPQDLFLLFSDDQAGVCGSAAITALLYDLEIDGQFVPQGTWMLRQVFFHLRQGHPLQQQSDRFIRIVETFHLGLFHHLWQLAERSGHKMVLSVQHDMDAHADLNFFGAFTFMSELIEHDDDLCVAMGVMPLTAQVYDTYQQKIRALQQAQPEIYVPVLLSNDISKHTRTS